MMALRSLPNPLMAPVDVEHRLLVAEAGRDSRTGLTANVLFGKGAETLGMQRVSFSLMESRAAAVEVWAGVSGCPADSLDRALLQMAGELEMLVRESEAAATISTRSDKRLSGESLKLTDSEPWADPVDGGDVLDEVRDLFAEYLSLASGAADVMALWVAHTYVFDRFDHTGYLAIVSPQKRSGKTTALTVLGAVAARPLPAGNVSPAAVYRVIQEHQPTLLVDELDRVPADSDLWSVLNTGHTRGTPVIRTAGEAFEIRAFATFGPKVLVYIRKSRTSVPDTIEDRCIRIMIQRQAAAERRPKVRSRVLEEQAGPIRSRLARWARDLGEDLVPVEAPAVLDDRAADSWEPLLALAGAAGGEWPARAADLAVRFSVGRPDEETDGDISALLLADLSELIESGRVDLSIGVSAEEVVRELATLPDRPWSTFGRSAKPITTTTLARLLKAYGLESKQTGPKTARVKRYPTEEVREVIARYVGNKPGGRDQACSPAHPPESDSLSDWERSGERVSDLKPLTGDLQGDTHTLTEEASPEPDPSDCRACGRDSRDGECIVVTRISAEGGERAKVPHVASSLGPGRKASVGRSCSSCGMPNTTRLCGFTALCERCAVIRAERAS